MCNDRPITVGILEAGEPPATLATRHDGYAAMFARLIGPGFAYRSWAVRKGEFPALADACDAWLITGSSAGVYESDAWIAELKQFVRQAGGSRPMIGVCFGHQIMAEAFGGKVIRSPGGWGIGLHRYTISDPPDWIDSASISTQIRLPASHQDQVVSIPADARVIGSSDFTPFALIDYPARRAMSIQAHPEFETDFIAALIESRRGTRFDASTADRAIASLSGDPSGSDRQRVAGWMRRFLRTACTRVPQARGHDA